MNETKSYKNINLSDLGTRQKITQVASRVALFVPRLLGTLATKLVVNPITKLTTGQTYEQVRNAAVDITMAVQEEQAAALDAKIDEGYQNLEDWREDTDYYISNLGKYKSYQSTIEDLEKKQVRLINSPKKLLVAKHYCYVMSRFRKEHKAEIRNNKMKERIKKEYKEKQAALKEQQEEIQALIAALRESDARYRAMKKEFAQYEVDYANILGQPAVEEDSIEVTTEEPVVSSEEVVVEAPTMRVPTESDLNVGQPAVATVAEEVAAPEVPTPSFGTPTGIVLEQSPVNEALLAEMGNMANMGQVPVSDVSTLEAYGLAGEGNQKKL